VLVVIQAVKMAGSPFQTSMPAWLCILDCVYADECWRRERGFLTIFGSHGPTLLKVFAVVKRETECWDSFEGHRLCLRDDWDHWALFDVWFFKSVRQPASWPGVIGVHWGRNVGLEGQKGNICRACFSRWP
jgi:hypothetical protein